MELKQILENRELVRKGINEWYKMPPSKFGGREVLQLHWWMQTVLVPYLKALDEKLEGQLKL